ncbi:MAG: hypothetical protein P1U58_08840 [Verrucomicrobiales bacterium]|nr:hypothetical protein [Verrucomicrobiales bacterium]
MTVIFRLLGVWTVILLLMGIQFLSWSVLAKVTLLMFGVEGSKIGDLVTYSSGILGMGFGYLAFIGGESILRSINKKKE